MYEKKSLVGLQKTDMDPVIKTTVPGVYMLKKNSRSLLTNGELDVLTKLMEQQRQK